MISKVTVGIISAALLHHRYERVILELNLFNFDCVSQGDYDAAGEILEEAMEIRKATLGENHIHYAYSLYNVAMLRSRQVSSFSLFKS